MAEVGYLLQRKGSPRAEAAFLRSLAAGDFRAVELSVDDYARMADLVDTCPLVGWAVGLLLSRGTVFEPSGRAR